MTVTETDLAGAEDTSIRVVQNVLLRPDQDFDVRPLYLGGIGPLTSVGDEDDDDDKEWGSGATVRYVDNITGLSGHGHVTDEGHLVVVPEERVTLGTYFNAFPASYWRRWSSFSHVRLTLTVSGDGAIFIYRSTAKGHVVQAGLVQVKGDEPVTHHLDLELKPFIDGGWYWFDVQAGEGECTLESASWGFETDKTTSGTLSIGITTFNRPDFCAAQLVNLAQDPSVLEIIDEIIVVDQGNQKVKDDPQYADAVGVLGEKLRIIDQQNLGGSGGFSRSMAEVVAAGKSDYCLLLDDDVVAELEGFKRGVAFADLADRDVIVGGHMLSLYDRSVLHAFGEALSKYTWFWGPAPGTTHGHDFSSHSIRWTPWLHRRIDVDYNGWWQCLIPTKVIREIGLSLPMFIKWDDAEFGIRAGKAGFPTVTLPGMAVWHVPWTEKDDTVDWQAYFHERNRLVSALLHSPYEHGGALVKESWTNHVKRAIAMQYGTGELILTALEDVLGGPERMHRDIVHRLSEVREIRGRYTDAQALPDLESFPAPRTKKPPKKGKGGGLPNSRMGGIKMAFSGLARQALPVRELSREHPEQIVPHIHQRWFSLAQYDAAVVSAADGVSASLYRREPAIFKDQMKRSAKLHARLYREWPELAARYRDALPVITSPEAWKPTFEGNVEG